MRRTKVSTPGRNGEYTADHVHRVVEAAEKFHLARGRVGHYMWAHAKEVLDTALDPERGIINLDRPSEHGVMLASAICFHTVDMDEARKRGVQIAVPSKSGQGLRYDRELCRQLGLFCALRALDESENPDIKEYARLLAKPEVALLARIYDIAILHDHTDKPGKEIKDWDVFHNPKAGWAVAKVNIGKRGRVYAPFAEMFGLKDILDVIREICYYESDQEFYLDVKRKLGALREKIERTKSVVERVLRRLEEKLCEMNVNFKIVRRNQERLLWGPPTASVGVILEKSLGSVLEKLERQPSIGYDPERLNDLVAFKVLVSHYHAAILAADAYRNVLEDLMETGQIPRFTVVPDDLIHFGGKRGYQSYHVDSHPIDASFVNFEAIFRDSHMDHMAENGDCAHFLYKGFPELHTRDIQWEYYGIVDALRTGMEAVLSKLSEPHTGKNIPTTIVFADKSGPAQTLDVQDVYEACTYIDALAKGFKILKDKDPKFRFEGGFRVVQPPNLRLMDPIQGSYLQLRVEYGTNDFPFHGRVARDMIERAASVEGATLLSKLAGIHN